MSLNLLAIDTSTEACSVALLYGDESITRYQFLPCQHNRLLLPMLEEVLSESGIARSSIDVLAFGCGPGSFTGLRIAASVVQSIAFAWDLPVVPISTLRALAQGAYRDFSVDKILTAINACINEIYWGCYLLDTNHIMQQMTQEKAIFPAMAEIPKNDISDWSGVGSGWDMYHPVLQKKFAERLLQWFPHRFPHAYDVAVLALNDYQQGKIVSAEQALPVYLRDNITKK